MLRTQVACAGLRTAHPTKLCHFCPRLPVQLEHHSGSAVNSQLRFSRIDMAPAKWRNGTVVWARVAGSPWWPALVVPYEQIYFLPLSSKKPPLSIDRVTVMLFRYGKLAVVPEKNVVPFESNSHHVNIRGRQSASVQLAYLNARQYVQIHGIARRLSFINPHLTAPSGKKYTDDAVSVLRERIENAREQRIKFIRQKMVLLEEADALKKKLAELN